MRVILFFLLITFAVNVLSQAVDLGFEVSYINYTDFYRRKLSNDQLGDTSWNYQRRGGDHYHFNDLENAFKKRDAISINMGLFNSNDGNGSYAFYKWGWTNILPKKSNIPVPITYDTITKWGWSMTVRDTVAATVNSNMWEINFKAGLGIKPINDPYFNIYMGTGLLLFRYKVTYSLPSINNGNFEFTFLEEIMESSPKEKNGSYIVGDLGARIPAFIGAQYEFEKFNIFGEGGGVFTMPTENSGMVPRSFFFNLGISWYLDSYIGLNSTLFDNR